MNDQTVITAAYELLKRVGVSGWSVSIVDAIPSDDADKTIHGLAKYAQKKILLRHQSMEEDDVFARNVISHEVTHAYFGAGSDHDSGDFGVEWCAFRRLLDTICGCEPDMRPACVYCN